MSVENCSAFGSDPGMLYGYAARKIKNGLEVVLCIPVINNPIEFDVEAPHSEAESTTNLGYQLNKAEQTIIIYTNKSKMPTHLCDTLEEICTLVNYEQVEFEMCVGAQDVLLPRAEYNGDSIQPIDIPINNRCNHEYRSATAFLQSVLGYPIP